MFIEGYAAVNGTRLYYEVTGEGHPLVLIHSGYTDLRLWDYQIELLQKHFKVIRYDVRGYGKSARPCGPFSNSQDLKKLLDFLGIDKVHLIGVSMGGGIAIDFTLEYPDCVEYLILSGSSLPGFRPVLDEASRKRSTAAMSIVTRDERFNQSVDFMLQDPMWRQSNPQSRQHLKEMFMGTSLSWLLDDVVQVSNPPAADRLSELRKRCLLIVGSEDSQPVLATAGVLGSQLALAQKTVINGTGHLPNLDKPEEFNHVALSFLLDN